MSALPLSAALYPRHCVDAATEAFGDYCTVTLEEGEGGSSLSLAVRPTEEGDAARVVGEYFNYLLALSVRSRSTA